MKISKYISQVQKLTLDTDTLVGGEIKIHSEYVDAIPIEWIIEFIKPLHDSEGVELIDGMLNKWSMENEADISTFEKVDAVPIVRCKDCKHRPIGEGFNHDVHPPMINEDECLFDYKCPCVCDDSWYSWVPDDDWFCANGEIENG